MCCEDEGHRALKQGKKQGIRVLGNVVDKSRLYGLITKGKKRIATVLDSRENSSECCSPCYSNRSRTAANICLMENRSPVLVNEQNLAMGANVESLPLDILVRIFCHVHHDELEPLFYVSSKFREAVSVARRMHFDYTTPVRMTASRKRENSLIPEEISENHSRFEGLESLYSSSRRPATPNAPKQVRKFHKARISIGAMENIPTLLFPPGAPGKDCKTSFVNENHSLRSGPAPNRALFIEHELCL